MEALNSKVTGDSLTASEWNQVPSELQNIIVALGQSLTAADLNQLGKALAGYVGSGNAYIDSGSANAIVLSPITGLQAPPKYTNKMRVRFSKSITNTGAVTINVAGIGVLNLKDQFGAALIAGDLVAGTDYKADYDPIIDGGGPGFKYVKPSTTTNDLARGYIDGLITSNNALDAANDIDIAIGACRDSTNSVDMILSTALGKQIDVAYAEGGTPGVTLGGMPPSLLPVTNNTWYRVFAIRKTTGQVDAGFDTAANASALLGAAGASYTHYRQIGWVRYGVGTIIQYFQTGDDFTWATPIADAVALAAVAAKTALVTTVPPDTIGRYSITFSATAGGPFYAIITEARGGDPVPSAALRDLTALFTNGYINCQELERYANSSSQIYHRSTGVNAIYDLNTKGFIYRRGKQ